MAFQVTYFKHTLDFKFEAGTSRGVLTHKPTYFVLISDQRSPGIFGLGECAVLKGLSIDDMPDYESHLQRICRQIPDKLAERRDWKTEEAISHIINWIGDLFPSVQFGVETALRDLIHGGNRIVFTNSFSAGKTGIPINGLIWMGEPDFMRRQIDEKLAQGYTCIKMKIGAIDFEKECELLAYIRRYYPAEQITLRVDANGAFSATEALEKLTYLSRFNLHSIEQPVRQGQWKTMAELCRYTPLPIALDEELIGISTYEQKIELLQTIKPQYIILKPSLLGGFRHCLEWINLAEESGIGWWITSALESNVGLNAISQFTASLSNPLPQGLGTGQLYTNNIDSPLEINQGFLYYNPGKSWRVELEN